ncbi:MAG: TerC family protein [Phycisphaerae bacterium]|nr:TerC family protein [Phycisphaerae bacterium]
MPNTWLWVGFAVVVLGMLALDLGVFNRKARTISMRVAAFWTIVWVSLAMAFAGAVWHWQGGHRAVLFLTGYLIEESLSMDNVFVFVLILTYFAVPREYHHRVLFWGVMGALVLRAVMILGGIVLIHAFAWILYLFGAFLVLTGVKLAFEKDKRIQPEKNPLLRLFRRLMPITTEYEGARFFVRRDGRFWATPLFVVVLVIETTDVIFAIDSIPAIFSITTDPFIVYTSNVFAILGLRSLYFLLAGMMRLFHHLHYGLSLILTFVGVKMLIGHYWETHHPDAAAPIPNWVTLTVVAGVLALSVVASVIWPAKKEEQE